jgi:carbon storage regulator
MARTFTIEARRCTTLVLSRNVGESIIISDDIVVTVVEIRGDRIKLGISAPKHVRVDREEVRRAIDRQARELAQREDVGT